MLKITANLKTGRLETLTANQIWTRRKITVKKKPMVGGDQKGPSIFLKIGFSNKQDVLIPNLASQILHGFYIKSEEKIQF